MQLCSSLQDNLLLDIYLAPHVRTLYTQIRNRALIQVSRARPARLRTHTLCWFYIFRLLSPNRQGCVFLFFLFCFFSVVFQPVCVGRHDQDGAGLQHFSSGARGRAHSAHTGGPHQRTHRLPQQGNGAAPNGCPRTVGRASLAISILKGAVGMM